MTRTGPRMGPTQAPRQGPSAGYGGPLVGYVSTFVTEFANDDSTIALTVLMDVPVDAPGPFRLTTTGTLPDGYATGTDYWFAAVVGPTDTGGLAVSRANALTNTRVHFNDDGSGVHTIAYTGE